ncbi:uncharacterized protein N7487_003987 [Penicillium crustosum]|uniref:uncharacterized protein n=1 Tax=Penicillium crustosum TaxID=36656 RepID=UPI0023A48D95|nr:uncharacterized protein N7487_003987 [Penicillium crustosum]KAJ5409628.1 hypothetical protein N7487_003987 [Penicillium crustosum]
MTSTLQGNLPEVKTEINKPRTKPFAALCHRPRVFLPIQSFPVLELLAFQSCSVMFVHPWIYPRQLELWNNPQLNESVSIQSNAKACWNAFCLLLSSRTWPHF